MPLEILVPLVVVGLTIMIGAVHLAGGSNKNSILDADRVNSRFAIDFPEFRSEEIVLDDACSRAFLLGSNSDELGYVQNMGQHCLTRLLTPHSVAKLSTNANSLMIELSDPGLPNISFTKSDEHQLMQLTALLNKSKGSAHDDDHS